jgi:hypothetical protein
MSNQGTIRLKVTNGAPAIEKLWNGRFKLEFFCDNNSPREDWYYENVSALLPEYGILQATNFGSGVSEDWEAIPDSVYPNMRLVLAEYPYNVRAGKHYVKLTYETLTASWVEEKDEDTDYELNGLKRVSRTFVALPGTVYDKVVGTSTIDSGGTTLYLGSFKIEKTEAKWELTEVWFEAGTLSESSSNESEGVIKVTTVFFHTAGVTVGPIIAQSTDNIDGLPTISITTLQGANGESIIGSGERLANSYEQLSQFTYPGIAEIDKTTVAGSGSSYSSYQWKLTPPAQGLIEVTTYVIFQSSPQISPSDYTYGGASRLWNPLSWASGETYGIGFGYTPFAESKGFRGYRAVPSNYNVYEGPTTNGPNYLINGNRIYAGNQAGISIKGGPEDPSGNIYTLNVKITPAFEDIDDVTSYKKVISVATIPLRPFLLTVSGGNGSGEYENGEIVPISTTVGTGEIFTGWRSDDGEIQDSSATSTNFVMPNESAIVTASFAYDPSILYELDVYFGSGDGDYAYRTQVTLVADNRAGKTFTHWSTNDGGIIWSPSDATTTYTMPPNSALVTANYT